MCLTCYDIQVQKSFNMDVGIHHAKNRGNKEIPLAILSRILAQSCVILCLDYVCREGLRMIVLVSLIVLLRGFPYFYDLFQGSRSYAHAYMRNVHCALSHVSLV